MSPPSPGFVTREVPGCGVAAFAARAFEPGETVFEECAVLVSAVGAPGEEGAANRQLWQALVQEERGRRLPAFEPAGHLGALRALRDLGLATCRERLLTKCVGPEESLPSPQDARREAQVLRAALGKGLLPHTASAITPGEYARLRRVIQLNGFRFNGSLQEGESGYDIGEVLFDQISRINHSCEPNLSFDLAWCESAGTAQIRVEALQRIQEGDEVNISYLPLSTRQTLAPPERRRQLREHWLFTCGCSRCGRELPSEGPPKELAKVVSSKCGGAELSAAPAGRRAREASPGGSSTSSQGICWDDLADPEGEGTLA